MPVIATVEQLEAIYGQPNEASTVKVADRIRPQYQRADRQVAVRGAGNRRRRSRSTLHRPVPNGSDLSATAIKPKLSAIASAVA